MTGRKRGRLRAGLVGVLMALALALNGAGSGGVRAAPSAPGSADTWAAEWTIVGADSAAPGALTGLQFRPGAAGLALAGGAGNGQLETPVHDMEHAFTGVGILWQAAVPAGGHLELAVRTSLDGAFWTPWQVLPEEVGGPDVAPGGLRYSELALGKGRYVQARVALGSAGGDSPTVQFVKLVAIDASAGPQAGDLAASGPAIISRAQWGANESYMTWPPEYAPVTHVVLHHTDTTNNIPDPAATVRTIYYYHAVTLDWGDIGYNYLIDREGRIYEGRSGGDGVIAGHARPYNRGTIGVAILGNYAASAVPAPALSALEDLLAAKCNLHLINPLQSQWLLDKTFPTIMGHRDCNATTCPGDRAYALLPQIRSAVSARLQALPPRAVVDAPAAGATLAGVVPVRWRAGPQATQVSLAIDGQVRATFAPSVTAWAWDTAAERDEQHTLRVTVTSAQGQSSSTELTVRTDNTPPVGSLSAPQYTAGDGVDLTLGCAGCTAMQFSLGWRWESEDQWHQGGTGRGVADPLAGNGRAWMGAPGEAVPGAWYGPYYCALPWPGDYEAVFWLRGQASPATVVLAELDVSDQAGTRLLAGPRPLIAAELAPGRYQGVRAPFRYPDRGTSCVQTGVNDGLELRTWYRAGELWLDRVEVYTAPQPFAPTRRLALPDEGRYPVQARFLDGAGNASPVYEQTVIVDRTPPSWGAVDREGIRLQDALSGVDGAGAAYALSADGHAWGAWTPFAVMTSGNGGIAPGQPSWCGRWVKVRARDRAGNVSESAPVLWTGDLCSGLPPELVRSRTYAPAVMRDP